MVLNWRITKLTELDVLDAVQVFELRQRVFVLEQQCLYQDIDATDLEAWHLRGRTEDNLLVAYLRIIPPLSKYPGPAIGRVVTHPDVRGQGLGRMLMLEGLRRTDELFAAESVFLSAQTYLINFYASLGFVTDGEPFDEDGIEHIEMVRTTEA
jgi:ElaA protein